MVAYVAPTVFSVSVVVASTVVIVLPTMIVASAVIMVVVVCYPVGMAVKTAHGRTSSNWSTDATNEVPARGG